MSRKWMSHHDYAEDARLGRKDASRCDNCLGKTKGKCQGCVLTGDTIYKTDLVIKAKKKDGYK